MSIKDRIQTLCKQKGITSKELELQLGFGRGYISKMDKSNPTASNLKKIADYLGVTVGYILSDTELNVRDERDIKKDLDSLREKLANKEFGPAAYDGQEIPDEDIDLFLGQVDLMLRRVKVKNKEKYNPNKNKK